MTQVTLKGQPADILGTNLEIGEMTPQVDVVLKSLEIKSVGGKQNKVQIIATLPSLDTHSCAKEAKTFNEKMMLVSGVDMTIVSMDLPFASGRFCSTEGIDNLCVGSDFRAKALSNAYGVLIGSGDFEGLCARAVFVINKEGKLAYKEIVQELTKEPNYDLAIEAVKSLV